MYTDSFPYCVLFNRYARKHFPPANVDGTMTKEIQRAMALLAFKPETSCSPYRVSDRHMVRYNHKICLIEYKQFTKVAHKDSQSSQFSQSSALSVDTLFARVLSVGISFKGLRN